MECECIICQKHDDPDDKLRNPSRGFEKIEQYGKIFNRSGLLDTLKKVPKTDLRIHVSCQKKISNDIRKHSLAASKDEPVAKMKRRSEENPFIGCKHCLFCGNYAIEDERHPDRQHSMISFPETVDIHHLLTICDRPERKNNSFVHTVRGRLMAINDLQAGRHRYHRSCYRDFCREEIVCDEAPSVKQPGRPVSEEKSACFDSLCAWLEMEVEPYTISELRDKMTEFAAEEGEAYATNYYLKQNLKKRYGNKIFFSEVNGKSDVLCFNDFASSIVNEFRTTQSKDNHELKPNDIIEAAAKLILNEIRLKRYDCTTYPSEEVIASTKENKAWLTPGLRKFMECCIRCPLRQASIGQSITFAVKPKSCIPPILFGCAVEMDHMFGSKWQMTELNNLAYSVCYKEVARYKQCVIRNDDVSKYVKENMQGCFGQWSADNVDIRVCDLLGKNSLHAMGIVLSTTNPSGAQHKTSSLIRRDKLTKVEEVVHDKGIKILPYSSEIGGLSKVILKKMSTLLQYHHLSKISEDLPLDLLWHSIHFIPRLAESHPGWTGYMTDVSKGYYPGKSNVTMLPIIDLDPNDMSCIYSTLMFVIGQAKDLNIHTPVVTFDQPLWVKANEISLALGLDIVVVLGGFHTLMSFMGSIGSIMAGSGLSEAMNTVYGADVVKHISSGKAIARSLRGNFLVESVLTNSLMQNLFSADVEDFNDEDEENLLVRDVDDNSKIINEAKIKVEPVTIEDIDEIEKCHEELKQSYENGLNFLNHSKSFKKVKQGLSVLKDHLCKCSRTSKLWINYLRYTDISKRFIRAERTGNWSLHLQCISEMLNLFAATGHHFYAKCARLYLQQMSELEYNFPWVYEQFANKGYHTIRRTDRYWAGLWSDLIIEQVMMRSLKSRGGLSGGRGTTESVRLTWVHSMHRCASVHNAMATLTGNHHKTSEQHIELGENRVKQDINDMQKIKRWFDTRDPFDANFEGLRSLSSGLCATTENHIDCDEAEKVGSSIQQKMDNISFSDASILRKDQAKTLDTLQPGIVIENKTVNIDPLILFTRVSTLVERLDVDSQNKSFEHEFTPEPTALFKDGLMRKASKEDLRNHLIDYSLRIERPKTDVCVIDGGGALYKSPWALNMSFSDFASNFITDLITKYSIFGELQIVFDGYDDEFSTKTDAHDDRGKGVKIAANVHISEDGNTPVLSQKTEFLRNTHNKKELIRFLRSRLTDAGISSIIATGDADGLIVSTALRNAEEGRRTLVVSDDTDVLVLLYYHHSHRIADIFYQTSRKVPVIPKEGASVAQIKQATAKSKQKPIPMWWSVANLNSRDIPQQLALFIHAWCGCDTTSAICGKGKLKVLSLIKDSSYRQCAEVFTRKESTQEQIGEAGTRLMVKMYNGKWDDTPATVRRNSWNIMMNEKSNITPSTLCPTMRAIYFHSLRTYLQIHRWDTLNEHILNPADCGFYKQRNGWMPIKTDLEAAPKIVLKIVRCNCKMSSRNTCGTMLCSCRKNGLPCGKACGDCQGKNCLNISLAYVTNEDMEAIDP